MLCVDRCSYWFNFSTILLVQKQNMHQSKKLQTLQIIKSNIIHASIYNHNSSEQIGSLIIELTSSMLSVGRCSHWFSFSTIPLIPKQTKHQTKEFPTLQIIMNNIIHASVYNHNSNEQIGSLINELASSVLSVEQGGVHKGVEANR